MKNINDTLAKARNPSFQRSFFGALTLCLTGPIIALLPVQNRLQAAPLAAAGITQKTQVIGGIGGFGGIGGIYDPGSHKPDAVKTLRVKGRTDRSVELHWRDRANNEEETILRRRGAVGGWLEIASWGPLSDWHTHNDTGLEADTLYCYQFISRNDAGDAYSPQRCAYTRDGQEEVVFRAQLLLETADVEAAGTDDRVTVMLNSPTSIYVPNYNETVVDYGQNDFERGDRFFYDLELLSLDDRGDVTIISIHKDGSDAWCIKSLALLINDQFVYSQEFGDTADTCQWIGDDHSSTFTIWHEELRTHPSWGEFVQQFPLSLDRDEIESRLEGMIGHLISNDDQVYWGHRYGRAFVEASRKSEDTIHVDLDLAADVWGFDPEVDIDFDVKFAFEENDEDGYDLVISTHNLVPEVDWDWFTETLSFILPCGPVVSVIEDEGIPDCISALEDYIEEQIRAGFAPIAQQLNIGAPCPEGFRPDTLVDEDTTLHFRCVVEESELPAIQWFSSEMAPIPSIKAPSLVRKPLPFGRPVLRKIR